MIGEMNSAVEAVQKWPLKVRYGGYSRSSNYDIMYTKVQLVRVLVSGEESPH